MNKKRISEIRSRLSNATPRPWRSIPMGSDGSVIWAGGNTVYTSRRVGRCAEFADADLIAHAPKDLADLLDEVERLLALQERFER